ncbi:hypothetical protein CHS0354_031670 [Potamilus streckersoni]|uniref:Trehalase n=1 Tax=Potamilus streckersoni TaxID=2493646 RepID=A0AAE0SRU4_9BIVA|nr:hypothetical protein CHS0354_031670 [Potamilus streckersoni]
MMCIRYIFVVLVLITRATFSLGNDDIYPCESRIYCYGQILEAVQMANLFPDSKTFVDMNLKSSPDDIFAKFKQLGNYSKEDLYKFVTDNFAGPGEELQQWKPPDFVENPSFLADIRDADLKDFAKHLCKIWSDLGKTVNIDVKQNPDKYSFLYLEKPFIVPGKRFREVYYWDSYWIVKGLLACQMQTTVKGMLENMISLVKRFGFVPNGGRIYYAMRSQPPFLIPMVYEYYQTTHDLIFLQDNIQHLEDEYEFWQRNRTISILRNGTLHKLNHYASPVNGPRPESYKEDIITFDGMTEVEKRTVLPHITSACESGWDFSSRWMKRDPHQPLTLNTTITSDIVPVDLNSVLCWNEKIMAYFYNITGNVTKSSYFQDQHNRRRASIQDVLWNDDVGIWQDYTVGKESHRDYFYASHIYPLFADCVSNDHNSVEREKRIIAYLEQQQVLHYEGGVPASIINTTQQWDFPNAWPPLQHVMIKSLERGKLQTTRDKALYLTSKWIYSNWKGWKETGKMFEKYDATKPGKRGGGGEYDVQARFGWTNGVVLDLLKEYGSQISLQEIPQFDSTKDGAFLKEATTCKSEGTTLDILMVFILSFTILIFNFLTICQRM